MKTTIVSLLRSIGFAVTLLSASSFALAASANDPAADALMRDGSVIIHAAGPYVEVGTFRVQVLAKLGQPDLKFADGTWLYHRRRIENSAAVGSLVIQFKAGRVQSLSLVTPAVVATLEAAQSKSVTPAFVAVK